MSYKIRIDWNYLYGFSDDDEVWYTSAMEVMPRLYHLFPPNLRQVWINRESRIFKESEKKQLKPVGSKIFHAGFSDDMEVFYQTEAKDELNGLYKELVQEIEHWTRCFFKGYQLCIVYDDFEGIHIMRNYEIEEHFFLKEIEAQIYVCIFQPMSLKSIQQILGGECGYLENILNTFVNRKIAIFIDGKYLALATRSTQYKWNKYSLLKSLFDEQ